MTYAREPEPKAPIFDAGAWRYFSRFFQGRCTLLALASLASCLQAFLVLPLILLVRYCFDTVIPANDISMLLLIGLAILGLNLLSGGLSIWVKHVNIGIIHAAIFRLREDLLLRLYGFSRHFFTDNDQKIVHTRLVQDTERLSNMSNALVSKLIPALILSMTLSIVLLFLNYRLFLLLFLLFPAMFLLHRHMGKRLQKKVYGFQRAFETFSRGIFFVLRFMDLTRIEAVEHQAIEKQKNHIQHLADTSAAMHFYYALNGQLNSFITGLSGITILIFGGAAIAAGSMSVGDLFAYYLAAGYLYRHASVITDAFIQIVAGNASLVTLFALAETNDSQPQFGKRPIEFQGTIEFRSVSFGFAGTPFLRNIDLKITPGCKLAIIGANGSGKTTLIHLILGFYAPHSGSIRADGIPYDTLDIARLRKSIGVVLQNPPIFTGTVLENITFGIGETALETVEAVSRYTLAHDFITALPQGYHTPVGEEGSQLSGGQCQKIAITRALLRRPCLLILDEPTNHLDKASAAQLMDSLVQMQDRPALLIVSHDAGILDHMDRVLELADGSLNSLAN